LLPQPWRESVLCRIEANVLKDIDKSLVRRIFDIRLGRPIALHTLKERVELRIIGESDNRAALGSSENGESSGAKRRGCDWAGKIKYEDELRVDAERCAAFDMDGGKRSRATLYLRSMRGTIAMDGRPVSTATRVARAVRLSGNEAEMR
jgi:hypothetical protein